MHLVSEDAVSAGDDAMWAHLLSGLLPEGWGPQQQVSHVPHCKASPSAAPMLTSRRSLVHPYTDSHLSYQLVP